jgi:hypothetical protein
VSAAAAPFLRRPGKRSRLICRHAAREVGEEQQHTAGLPPVAGLASPRAGTLTFLLCSPIAAVGPPWLPPHSQIEGAGEGGVVLEGGAAVDLLSASRSRRSSGTTLTPAKQGIGRVLEGVKGLTKVALASLHNRECSWAAFPRMRVGTLLLHLGSLHKALCSLPNIGGLHSISLDRPYAGYQSHP